MKIEQIILTLDKNTKDAKNKQTKTEISNENTEDLTL